MVIPIFSHILRATDNVSKTWRTDLKKCTKDWLKAFGLPKTLQILNDNELDITIITTIFKDGGDMEINDFELHA